MWPTSADFERGPWSPKKMTSAGCSLAREIRFDAGTSPLIWKVVRPRSRAAGIRSPGTPRACRRARRSRSSRSRRGTRGRTALGAVALAAPDVRHPDPCDGGVEDRRLPVRELREDEAVREALDARDLPAREAEDLGGGEGGFGAGRGVSARARACPEGGRMVRAETEQPGDDLGAEASGHLQAGGACSGGELVRGLREAEDLDEAEVELGHRHRRVGLRELAGACAAARGTGSGRAAWDGRRRDWWGSSSAVGAVTVGSRRRAESVGVRARAAIAGSRGWSRSRVGREDGLLQAEDEVLEGLRGQRVVRPEARRVLRRPSGRRPSRCGSRSRPRSRSAWRRRGRTRRPSRPGPARGELRR